MWTTNFKKNGNKSLEIELPQFRVNLTEEVQFQENQK